MEIVNIAEQDPGQRWLAIKLMARGGHAELIPEHWPERTTTLVNAQRRSWRLPPPSPESGAELPIGGSITSATFFDAIGRPESRASKIARVRAENKSRRTTDQGT